MCGGRGTRLGGDTEKPLTRVRGRQMVDRVCDALAESRVETTYAVVSPHTPETGAHLAERGAGGDRDDVNGRSDEMDAGDGSDVRVVDAPGEGYVADLRYALDALPLDGSRVLTVAADLPLLDGEAVDAVLEAARTAEADSVAVHVPAARKRALGVSADTAAVIDGRDLVPTGINVVATEAGEAAEGTVHVTDDRRVAVNVNYSSDVWIAEALLAATPDEPTWGDHR